MLQSFNSIKQNIISFENLIITTGFIISRFPFLRIRIEIRSMLLQNHTKISLLTRIEAWIRRRFEHFIIRFVMNCLWTIFTSNCKTTSASYHILSYRYIIPIFIGLLYWSATLFWKLWTSRVTTRNLWTRNF